MNAQQKFENVEEMLKEAEVTFRKGVGTLSTWAEQAQELIETRPGVVLAAVGISGFVTGALLRHGMAMRKGAAQGSSLQKLPADPIVLFVAGIIAGVTAGPRIVHEALSGLNRSDLLDNTVSIDGARLRSTGSMAEKPFEKY